MVVIMEDADFLLPPGFRFHPTDEEIIAYYLAPKILNHGFIARAMGVVDLNKCEPWDLPSKAKMGEKEWYFYCQRDRKYPTGTRTNRATVSGYWKATGKDKEIYRGKSEALIGMKKTLVFYTGRAPKGEKTNWVIHEYRLQGNCTSLSNLHKPSKDEWVVCRVFHKSNNGGKSSSIPTDHINLHRMFKEEISNPPNITLPPLVDPSHFTAGDGSGEFRAVEPPPPPPPMPSYFSSLNDGDDYIIMINNPTPAIRRRRWKAEQLSNQSMLSQDTGVSTDHFADVSSVVANGAEDFDAASMAAGGMLDLCGMWRC